MWYIGHSNLVTDDCSAINLVKHVKKKNLQVLSLCSVSCDNQEEMHARCIVNYDKGFFNGKDIPASPLASGVARGRWGWSPPPKI